MLGLGLWLRLRLGCDNIHNRLSYQYKENLLAVFKFKKLGDENDIPQLESSLMLNDN